MLEIVALRVPVLLYVNINKRVIKFARSDISLHFAPEPINVLASLYEHII